LSGETEREISGWTVDTLKGLLFAKVQAIEDLSEERNTRYERLANECDDRDGQMRVLMDERDVRYSQRFTAQQEALVQALAAAKEAVAAALLAADRAVTKAELASEKRFESVNEFRGALSDQTSKLLPRVEADQRFSSITEKIERLDKEQSSRGGAESQRLESRQMNQWAIGVVLVAGQIIVGVVLFALLHKP
jgi:hypothetical protein